MENQNEGQEGSSCCSSHCGGCCWGKAAVVLFLLLISAMAGFFLAKCHSRLCMRGMCPPGAVCPVTASNPSK